MNPSVLQYANRVHKAAAQTDSRPYCDSTTGVCYSSYESARGIFYNIALPSTPSNDAIIQIIAPLSIGWAGFSWEGHMSYNPLAVAWQNDDEVVVSSRLSFGPTYPNAYDGATYTILDGTGVNETHWILNARCQGCTYYESISSGTNITIDEGDTAKFAYAYSEEPPFVPADNTSLFNVHIEAGNWYHDIVGSRSESYAEWIETLSPEPTDLVRRDVPASCPNGGSPRFPGTTASGWRAVKVIGNLQTPRGIITDSNGNLLVVENGKGITGHRIGTDGCIASSSTVLSQNNLNHGIQLSPDGSTLYASSPTTVWSWAYDPDSMTVSGNPTTIVSGMVARGHVTRTLQIVPEHPNIIAVSHGSDGNLDYPSEDPSVARSCVKAFDISTAPANGHNYITDGWMMGYGLRNGVGITYDPNGMLWEIENSGDQFIRTVNGQQTDIHIDNPAEELNYLGDISQPNNDWYGYPTCFTVGPGGPSAIIDKVFDVGDQFVLTPNDTFNDETCIELSVPPKLSLQAHSAPLDMKFNAAGTNLYATFHGSWNREPPTGFKVVEIPFTQDGSGAYVPTAPPNSASGYTDIWWNNDVNSCSFSNCFRPAGMAIDSQDRLYVTSDAPLEGEIWLIGRV
ncbi:hypothetical protein AJ80_06774 [Polytolypa hystricis UAMH7299]|uniref:Uncharacterized protein n=1 Tax=Polytolypa hystricis (strain UAMH7299) TaxID=1447883 RepID=A0A2B7XTF1_POLH7|nr:hypothetical protein AJ80_06774 [Polytolypa hystricis UAMH7299]